MNDDAVQLAKDGMEKAIERLRRELSRVRAGRANPALLDEIKVDSYGSLMPLKQVATVSVADARLLVVKPYDRSTIAAIEKAINNSQLGLNPNNDGVVVRVPIPPLTEERRKQLVKTVKDAGEDAKIAIRQVRRETNDFLKAAEKDGTMSEDDLKRGLEQIQKLTDAEIKSVDDTVAKKEAEILDG
ncbi:MAG: ribosome recycling factor [Deltaproteobacteria bacterium]|jgi:ribosome recycling factor|nr:ribosome recycling factor [Deltaproteobacteria bacterium]MBK8240499.1 ribosome recycling factor [Deltaproteobacteria bacterium]MBK8718222.1 ribosome recycling factor [Deltaproteobacteria bacterium]MBP7289008.1 ribosome recycling factor [Nannocystaceae bacterium]